MSIILTKKLLEQIDACKEAIDFCGCNKLFGFPLDRLDEVQGDYNGFVRWIQRIQNLKFNDRGNVIELDFGTEGEIRKFKYDKNDNKIRIDYYYNEELCKNYTTFEYDKKGNVISEKLCRDSTSKIELFQHIIKEYDEHDRLIKFEDKLNDFWRICEYNIIGNCVAVKNSSNIELFITYDQNNNVIERKNSNKGYSYWEKFEYDSIGNVTKHENSEGHFRGYSPEYYDNGQLKKYGDLIIPYFEQ